MIQEVATNRKGWFYVLVDLDVRQTSEQEIRRVKMSLETTAKKIANREVSLTSRQKRPPVETIKS
ncbi:MAG: hypothetical protein BroJett011_77070 [Chloroflexota bacterium]|nr:MAG: hypothetical protein BroJett011_77070 [Chloroflexota bacterium]